MLHAYKRLEHIHETAGDRVTMDYDTRQKARIKMITDKGKELGIFLQRGHPLQIGEILVTECGTLIEIVGANEPVITASTDDWLAFSQVCYHLGNRHTKVHIGERWLRFKVDHVLQELAENYGLLVDAKPAVFEPESGAYGKGDTHCHDGDRKHVHEHAN